jgi:hypothetical protein
MGISPPPKDLGLTMQGNVMIVTELCEDGDLRSKLSSSETRDTYLWRNRGRKVSLEVSHR